MIECLLGKRRTTHQVIEQQKSPLNALRFQVLLVPVKVVRIDILLGSRSLKPLVNRREMGKIN